MSENNLPWANKNLGQHFLRDAKVIESICNDFAEEAEAILEIGPGPGILTEHLAKHPLPFQVIEKDRRFPEYLSQFISEDQINIQDAMKVYFEQFFEEKKFSGKKVWLVSNLPYNVGTPLLVSFLQAPTIKYMTLMFQKEVANKVYTTKSSLMCLCQTFFEAKLHCNVPPGAFQPPPKVDSAVVSLVRRENPAVPLEEFRKYEKFLRKLYQMKRKQVGKVLKPYYEQEFLESCLAKADAKRTDRAEIFNLEQVQLLYKLLECQNL